MLLTRILLLVVTVVIFPFLTGWYTDNNGSALWRTLWTSGTPLQMRLEALFAAYWWRKRENSLSVEREGWTETTTSEVRYAIRATAKVRQRCALPSGLVGGGAYLLASPADRTELEAMVPVWGVYVVCRDRSSGCYCILVVWYMRREAIDLCL